MKKLSALLLAGFLSSVAVSHADTVIYRETFDNTSGVQNGFNTVGWTALRATNGGVPVDSSNNSNSFAISTSNGAPTSAGPGVNAGANGSGTATGLPFETGGTYYAFNYTTEATTNPNVTSGILSSISFYEGNQNVNFTMQPMVKVGTQWYVSNQTFANPTALTGAQFPTDAVQQTLAINGSTLWRTLNFDTSSTFTTAGSIGATTTSLPAGLVTAWGLYGDYSNGAVGSLNARFDDFAVAVVPEPAEHVALAIAGGLGLLVYLRRGTKRRA